VIYPYQAPLQVRYLLEHSEHRVVFVAGEEELATVLEATSESRGTLRIIPWESELAERSAGNRELTRVERVRRLLVLDRDFSQQGG